MQSVDHWNILAEDTAGQLLQTLADKEDVGEDSCMYVVPVSTTFGLAFTNLLKSNLLNLSNTSNYRITDEYEIGCTQVDFSTQVIKHRTDKYGRLYPGTFTLLTGAIAVMRNFTWYESLVGAGVIADLVGGSFNTIPHNEILITTKIIDHNTLISMRTDMYYINDQDSWHYKEPQSLPVTQMTITGKK
jgi:hypothetical protein